ncbi:MAG: sugar phosphate isomerase/epimerase [Deltaproteobacteria bacterium]|nr:sugar phosphate isomerase/epimerase [Deltaproteobacteria bacterium]MBW2724068.1 sugar phosphate isomerase/epimerase [Deltaproteobacteria bacterium]
MSLNPGDLLLCAGTLAATPLVDRIAPTAAAGFQGLSVFTTDVASAAAAGVSLAELRSRIEAAGLAIGEVDPLANWFPSANHSEGLLAATEDEVFAIAEGLGARSVTAVVFPVTPPSQDELIDSFAKLCDRAAEHDLQVHLEFIPFTPVRTIADATVIVGAVDRPNGGIMLDVWHLIRSGGSASEVEAVAERVLGVQLDDAPHRSEENLVEETMHRRLLPGEGDADVAGVIRALREGGSSAPLGVEVFSDVLAALEPGEAAELAYRAARACVEKSG